MYYFDGRVRYSEVDSEGKLQFSAAIQYMQDCSIFQSEDNQRGIHYLKEHERLWLLSSWQVQVKQLPFLGDSIRIGTWAHKFQGIYGYRNFVIDDENGEHLLMANSIWVYYDLKKDRPAKITEEETKIYPLEEPLLMEEVSRKIEMPEHAKKEDPFRVRKANIDTNAHVNNSQYIQMAQEFLPDGFCVTGMRAEYRKSALYGEQIYPALLYMDGLVYVSLSDAWSKPYVVIEFQGK